MSAQKYRVLLLIDAVLNILIGAALLLSPLGMLELLGLPQADARGRSTRP